MRVSWTKLPRWLPVVGVLALLGGRPLAAQGPPGSHFERATIERPIRPEKLIHALVPASRGDRAVRGAAVGGLIGAAVGLLGAAYGYGLCADQPSDVPSCTRKAGLGLLISTGVGAAVGLIVGAADQ